MPQRYIQIPGPITFIDPLTKEAADPSGKPMTFEDFIYKLMDNPKWALSYKMIKSADAIMEACKKATRNVMIIAEEDLKNLQEAVENPKALILTAAGGQTISGFGLHPRITSQILPFCDAIMQPLTDDPRPKAVEIVEAARAG
jgi:hypothetical protein